MLLRRSLRASVRILGAMNGRLGVPADPMLPKDVCVGAGDIRRLVMVVAYHRDKHVTSGGRWAREYQVTTYAACALHSAHTSNGAMRGEPATVEDKDCLGGRAFLVAAQVKLNLARQLWVGREDVCDGAGVCLRVELLVLGWLFLSRPATRYRIFSN